MLMVTTVIDTGHLSGAETEAQREWASVPVPHCLSWATLLLAWLRKSRSQRVERDLNYHRPHQFFE